MVDKAWVHLCRADPAYEIGARNFVNSVASALGDCDLVICLCIDCRNVDRHSKNDVVDHLVTRGMDETYKLRTDWYHHGEVNCGSDEARKVIREWNEEIVGLYQAAEYLDEELANKTDLCDVAEGLDKREDEFLAKLGDAETPLYPSCASHSKLSAIVSLFRLKTQNGWSDKSFNELLETLPSMLPEDNVLHTSLYDVKKFIKSFHMGYEKIHACVNDCCLFRKRLKKLDNCLKCKTSRWKTNFQTGELKKGVPQKVLRYFPIIPRLKRMFRSEQTAKELRWHFTNKINDGKLRHPVDYVTWDQMNSKYPLFAAESRNIRLGLSTDGFNPFSMKNTRYSCWPVLLVNYNMAPDLCMKKENIMLSLLIPGPYQPGNSIDVYLEPLIDDLQQLWDIGEQTYDAFSKTTFTMKAMLLWTISDLPAYGNLAGCRVKGMMGCPLYGKHTDSLWLTNSRKHVYMCHRKGLSPTHSYRGKKAWFDGKVEYGRKGRILTGHNISVLLKNYKNEFENVRQTGRKRKRVIPAESLTDSEDEESESLLKIGGRLARFELDEEYHKMAVIKQMSYIWRASKLRLELSDTYKERRRNQIPHTCCRKGMVRLAEEMVWVKSRTKKDGTAVNTNAAEKIKKAAELVETVSSSSTSTNPKEDLLSQLLGPDNPGRLRAMGRGMSQTKLACFQMKSKFMDETRPTKIDSTGP
ncbi:uncharacterized protein LOC112087474 [Eutrema salsugineum]|uniref:uncharacterized protein LOC112087474 n=1 Tax=Eutrema salsugineum TaxID=72664 RepID=UPI000CED5ED9|nr:uncharacterized protein LOC112087474 [Eutrema salsugineum]